MSVKSIATLIGLGLLFILFLALSPFTVVGSGNRGVVTRLSAVTGEVLSEGFHWISPLESVTEMEVRVKKEETAASAASKDLQVVNANIAVNYHLDATKVALLFQEVGKDYGAKLIAPAVQESVKAATAQFTAEELITKREEVKDKIKFALADKLGKSYIVLDDVLITNFDFSAEFNKAIELKQTAQQDSLRAKNELEKVKIEAEQRVAQAQAEAEAIKIQAQAVTQQGGRDYVQLKAIEKWDGALPGQMIPGATVPFLDLNK